MPSRRRPTALSWGGSDIGLGGPFGEVPPEPESWPEPEEVASEGALAAAEAFLLALGTGDALAVWNMFSGSAQAYIVNLGIQRGMDFDLASRLRAGVATTDEMDDFLGDLMTGLQRDLAGIDMARIAFESKASPEAPMQVRVNLLVSLGPEMNDLQTAIPAGAIVLALEDETWRIDRLMGGGASRPGTGGGGPAS